MKNLPMNAMSLSRRRLLKHLTCASAAAAAATILPGCTAGSGGREEPLYRISLAQWSLHRTFQGGEADPMHFASIARQEFGFDAVEYVNQFYMDSLSDRIVEQLRQRAEDEGVRSLLIMVDGEGALGDPDAQARQRAVQNHHRWADAAHALGCHSIRVNAQSAGSFEEQMQLAADGLTQLADYCADLNLNVLVENHGGLSSNGQWLAGVMEAAAHPRVGTLPDFGNFVTDYETREEYDRYQGVRELMPYAKAVSAKSHAFDEQGREIHTDYRRMMDIVLEAGYRGWVGVEYEGEQHSEFDGIRLTRDLLQRVEQEKREAMRA